MWIKIRPFDIKLPTTANPYLLRENLAMEAGIVGLPNVGKSTLFNALSGAGAESANISNKTLLATNSRISVFDQHTTRPRVRVIPPAVNGTKPQIERFLT